METAAKTVKLCSKCKERPRAHPESTNPWCRQCNTEKQLEYQQTRQEMTESHGYADGVAAMRDFMEAYFKQFGNAVFSGFEISTMARKAGLPK